MGVNADTLKLRIVSTDITMDPVKTYEHMTYEVYHEGTGAIVASNKLTEFVEDVSKIQDVDSLLMRRAIHEYQVAAWQYGNTPALGGYSPFDVSLILEGWTFEKAGDSWNLRHPLSGEHDGIVILTADIWPQILERAAAIVGLVLPPPTWCFASSPEAGKLAASCVAVNSADAYNVYNDHGDGTFTLIGTAPTAGGGTITIEPGYYRVRMAGVKDGVVGILSNTVPVTVPGAAAVQVDAVSSMEPFEPKERWSLKRWWEGRKE